MSRSAFRSENPGYTYNVTTRQFLNNIFKYAELGHKKGTNDIKNLTRNNKAVESDSLCGTICDRHTLGNMQKMPRLRVAYSHKTDMPIFYMFMCLLLNSGGTALFLLSYYDVS